MTNMRKLTLKYSRSLEVENLISGIKTDITKRVGRKTITTVVGNTIQKEKMKR